MKKNPFLFAAVAALVVGAMPQPARAYPFAPNCKSFVSWMNTRKWSTPTRFSGPGTLNLNYNNMFHCMNVYITETSPMGTKVCLGEIMYNFMAEGPRWDAKQSNCRWK